MGRELWGGNKILRMEENSARQPAIARAVEKKRKIVKMNLILVAMFGIIWLPYHVYFIIVFYVPGTSIQVLSMYVLKFFEKKEQRN